MKEYTDSEIIECLRTRQSYVVHYLLDRYIPMIRHMVSKQGGTNDDARDIFQDSLIIIIEKIDKGQFTLTCKFSTFLYCIGEHLWKDLMNQRRSAANYLVKIHGAPEEVDFTEQMDRKMYEEIFTESFNSMGEVAKKIMRMYWQNKSPKEIAEKYGYTYGFVRKKKVEAQKQLAKRINEHPRYREMMLRDNAMREVVY